MVAQGHNSSFPERTRAAKYPNNSRDLCGLIVRKKICSWFSCWTMHAEVFHPKNPFFICLIDGALRCLCNLPQRFPPLKVNPAKWSSHHVAVMFLATLTWSSKKSKSCQIRNNSRYLRRSMFMKTIFMTFVSVGGMHCFWINLTALRAIFVDCGASRR